MSINNLKFLCKPISIWIASTNYLFQMRKALIENFLIKMFLSRKFSNQVMKGCFYISRKIVKVSPSHSLESWKVNQKSVHGWLEGTSMKWKLQWINTFTIVTRDWKIISNRLKFSFLWNQLLEVVVA